MLIQTTKGPKDNIKKENKISPDHPTPNLHRISAIDMMNYSSSTLSFLAQIWTRPKAGPTSWNPLAARPEALEGEEVLQVANGLGRASR